MKLLGFQWQMLYGGKFKRRKRYKRLENIDVLEELFKAVPE